MAGMNSANLEESLRNAVKQFIADIVEEEIKESVKRIEKKIRDSIPQIVMGVSSYYDVYNDQERVVITVKPHVQ